MLEIKTNRPNTALRKYIDSLISETSSINNRHIKPTYRAFLDDKYVLAIAVKRGIPKNLFMEIAQFSKLDDEQWSKSLGINVRTFQRHKKAEKHTFNPNHSERIFDIAEVFNEGIEVFDSLDDFKEWLNSPSIPLGNNKPIEMLDSSYGKELVMEELSRIEHGIFV